MKAWEEYITTAEFLVTIKCGQSSSQKHLKTAIGDAYFAVLHGLQTMCADCFIGIEDDPDTPKKAWLEAYRSLKHGVIYSACLHPDLKHFPEQVQSVASNVVFLQEARRSIHYHPRTAVDNGRAKFCVSIARQCLNSITEISKKDRTAFSAWIAFERKGGVADARKRARSDDPDALDIFNN